MRAVIVANGDMPFPEQDRRRIAPGDLLIAADGGMRHCLALGLTPAVLIGDLDSLGPEERRALDESGVRVIEHSPRKDATDLELAVRYALEQGADEALLLATAGSRWDQTLAAFLLAAGEGLAGLSLTLASGPQEARLIRGGETARVRGRRGDVLSLLPLSGDVMGITTEGLEYPLREGELSLGTTRGVSNVFLGETAIVRVREGTLLCIVTNYELDDVPREVDP